MKREDQRIRYRMIVTRREVRVKVSPHTVVAHTVFTALARPQACGVRTPFDDG